MDAGTVTLPVNPPLPLPIRVFTTGASQVVWTSWMGGPRTDLAWPRAIEAELHAAGRPAEVRCDAYPAKSTKAMLQTWDKHVIQWSPDVFIPQVGQFETVHLFLPAWLEAHVHSHHTRPGPVRSRYRKVTKRGWRELGKLQRAVDRRVDPNIFSRRPQRVAADLHDLIKRVRFVGSPLILVPDFLDPGETYASWFPGMEARSAVMNPVIDEVVASFDSPDVRRFSIRDVVAGMELEGEATPDGGHYTPEVHREIGRGMARVILEWAENQPHLKLPAPPGS